MLFAAALPAQEEDDGLTPDETRIRIQRLESELSELRRRVERVEVETGDEELRERTLARIYGDIGFRYHMLFESQTERTSRPEFRLHLGVFGTAFDQDEQRIRYDLRMTTAAVDANGKPTPAITWLPLPGYGALPGLAVDRFLIEYDFNRTASVTVGRFPSPYTGTEMLFDEDYQFQGLTQSARFDRFLSEPARRRVPRIELVGVQSFLAENSIGLPDVSDAQPVYFGGQFRLDLAPFESPELTETGELSPEITSEIEFRMVAGLHWYDGENELHKNLGVGYIGRTSNILDEDSELLSDFLVGEVYGEIRLLRTRRAVVKAWFHGLFNFHARGLDGSGDKNEYAFDAGASWGMDRFTERWDFNVSFRYFIIESDATLPEFNSEVVNTNIKGWEIALKVRVFTTMTAFGQFMITERADYDAPGFGRPSRRNPDRSSGQSFRMRFGIFLEF